MRTIVPSLLLLATLLAPVALAETGCERTAYYDRCTVDEGPICWELTVYADRSEWRQCGTDAPGLVEGLVDVAAGLAGEVAEILLEAVAGTGVSCPDDCHVRVNGEEVLCLNVDQQWLLHEPIVCRGPPL